MISPRNSVLKEGFDPLVFSSHPSSMRIKQTDACTSLTDRASAAPNQSSIMLTTFNPNDRIKESTGRQIFVNHMTAGDRPNSSVRELIVPSLGSRKHSHLRAEGSMRSKSV